jgi:hypothetical protein
MGKACRVHGGDEKCITSSIEMAFEKLIVAQLVKKFPDANGIRRFIPVSRRARHRPLS